MAHGQLESSAPIRGVTLVDGPLVCVVTGRHNEEGSGLAVHAFRWRDGSLVWRRRVMMGQMTPDLLVAKGGQLQMGRWRTRLGEATNPRDGAREENGEEAPELLRGGRLGVQDNTWYRRPIAMRKNLQAWTRGPLEGQLLCFDDDRSYTYQAAGKVLGVNGMLFGEGKIEGRLGKKAAWEAAFANATRVSGMTLAGDSLYVAGTFRGSIFVAAKDELRRYDARTGENSLPRSRFRLGPCTMGLSCAQGRLLLSLINGQLLCVGDP